MGQFDDAKDRIVQGAELAAEVYRFVADPEAVGTHALAAAYRTFMACHSGNFSEPVVHA